MITHTPRRLSVGTLLGNRGRLYACLGEAIEVVADGGDWARPQIDQLNAELDAIEAELARRSEAELSVYEAQRWLREKGR